MQAHETARLAASPMRPDDLPLFLALYTDADTMRYIGPALSAARATRAFHAACSQPRPLQGPHLFVVRERATHAPVGISGLVHYAESEMHAEVGIVLKSEGRGEGYGREGLAGITDETFRAFPVARVWVRCSALNPVVERMVASVGFVADEGTLSGPLAQRIWSIPRSARLLRRGLSNSKGTIQCGM